ncbi:MULTISPECIES: ComEA family DNA-binding protein [Actinomycetes]|uniref:Helix-hairpin-helix DNA-binding motif class 1 domain-containing protein n=2 Tax=Actinomycetes TaxID=1760 RepID=A0ABP6LRR5_9MICC
MEDHGLWDEAPVLSRRERLRQEREAALRRPARTRLRITAAVALVVALLAWLLVSWLISSPSSSEPLPEAPALDSAQEGAQEGAQETARREARPRETPPGAEGGPAPGQGTRPDEAPEQRSDETGDDGADPDGADHGGGQLVVHVVGAVQEPGVVELDPGARVHDAVEQAGGAEEDAALEVVNLAAPLVDGSLIHVPTHADVDAAERGASWVQDGHGGDAGNESESLGPHDAGHHDGGAPGTPVVDLNTAEAAELEQLPGIGPALAERILEHRARHGPFGSLEELAAVRGIGPAILEDVADQVTW